MQERLNFNQLYYFWVIAREGSIKKAGKKLNLTASGLSGQLKYLEEFLGKKLFDRKVRKLVLNDAGKVILDYANRIFTMSEEMTKTIRQHKPVKKALIRVGVLPSLSRTHIHEFILPLWKDSTVLVKVVEGGVDELLYQLENHNLEIILSDRAASVRKTGIRNYRLKPRKIVAVGAEKFAFARKDFPNSLNGLPMIQLTEHSHLRSEIEDYFSRHQISPQVIGEADDVILLRLGAEKGVCIAVLPQNTVQQSIAEKRLVKIGELAGVNADMWAIVQAKTRKDRILVKTIQKFIAYNK